MNACRTKATDRSDYSDCGVLPLCTPYGLAELYCQLTQPRKEDPFCYIHFSCYGLKVIKIQNQTFQLSLELILLDHWKDSADSNNY